MNIQEILKTMDYGTAPESQTTAKDWLKQSPFGHFINNKWLPGDKHFDSINPATAEKLAQISQADNSVVNKAVKAAAQAAPKWQALSGHERAKYLYAIARLIQKNARILSVLESLDNGKPIRESRDIDIPLAVRHFYHHAGWAQLLDSELPDHEALGVVGQVIPWNFPLLMMAWKIAPAIATGNTVVLKPAEQTSLTALYFAKLCQQANLPDGVVNIITGDGRVGEAIVNHKDIQKIAFTGSTEVGRKIRHATAGSGKKLSLELGGKSAFIVCEDADLDAAVEGVVDAIWFNQGEVCCAGSRLLIQESVAERFEQKLQERMNKLRIGDPLDKSTDVGAIINKEQQQKITDMVKTGVEQGARILQAPCELPKAGYYYPPTLLADVAPGDLVCQEEIFGPVLVGMTFRTPAEAVALANNSRYGLAATIWSENINLALHLAPQMQAGVVWINCANQFDAAAGFGGVKESGFGREGGFEGLFEYLKPTDTFSAKASTKKQLKASGENSATETMDTTPKMYIGGKQVRPDGGYSYAVLDAKGNTITQAGLGNRKDVRNAVEAAANAGQWSKMTAFQRQQVMYFLAENLSLRQDEFVDRLKDYGHSPNAAKKEVEQSIERINYYAAWCDKFDGKVHSVPMRAVAMAMHEPIGVIGMVCPAENPLLSFVSLMAPALAMGNRVVMLANEAFPLPALELYQVLNTSDVPAGTVNILSGRHEDMLKPLAGHLNLDALWYFGDQDGVTLVEQESALNLKRTWTHTDTKDWTSSKAQGKTFLRHSTEVKNIWTPYGE
jgi:aldehyde dehydrogenase (NAD+)